MKPTADGNLERLESFTQHFPYCHHKKRHYFFHSKHQDLHLNKMVAIETVNYTFSRALVYERRGLRHCKYYSY